MKLGGKILALNRLIKLVQISIFSSVAFVISFFEIPLFFVPNFYKLEFSNAVVLISGFFLGPLAGCATELLKVILKLAIKGSATFGLGDLANFAIGSALVIPSAAFYKKTRTLKGSYIAVLLGLFCMILLSAIVNYFLLIPAYAQIFSISEDKIISIANAINPLVTDRLTFILFTVCPFNLIKGLAVCTFTLLIYKKASSIINRLSYKFVK